MGFSHVVERHPRMCHHCGFHGTVPENVCVDCGIQTHAGCYDMVGGKCDMCTNGLDHKAVCALCLQPDKDAEEESKDATNRLSKRLVHWGRTWSRIDVPSDVLGDDYLTLTADGPWAAVVRKLGEDPTSTFLPTELPQRGNKKMVATVGEDEVYLSDPLVVHSWCQAAMQLHDVPEALDDKTKIVPGYDCKTYDKEDVFKEPKATWETHPCKVCGKTEGYTVFCFYHVTHYGGCRKCGPKTTVHPSCAVRKSDMQRYTRGGQSGVGFCTDLRNFRSVGASKHLDLLNCLSGINNNFSSDTWDLDPGDVPRRGGAPPPKRNPAPVKKGKKRKATEVVKPPESRKAPAKKGKEVVETRATEAPAVPDLDARLETFREEMRTELEDEALNTDDVEEIAARQVDALREEMRREMDAKIEALREEFAKEEEAELVD